MQIKPEQLAQRLKQQAVPLVWISGDESLLVQEASDLVRKFAREQGFTEREADIVARWLNQAGNITAPLKRSRQREKA